MSTPLFIFNNVTTFEVYINEGSSEVLDKCSPNQKIRIDFARYQAVNPRSFNCRTRFVTEKVKEK